MNKYMENERPGPENTAFDNVFDSIIDELIKLESLSPNENRTSIIEFILKQLCNITNSKAAFVFEFVNNNMIELKFCHLCDNYSFPKAHPMMFLAL